ncbi:Uncharacterised protein [Bordetella pertussis]|nr:Uncharacterised protein [Bordetella pertussis]
MGGAGLGVGGRQPAVEVGGRVAEQGQRLVAHGRLQGRAARARRLQRGAVQAALAAPLHRYVGMVGRQGEHAVALLLGQHGAQRDRGVAAEWHFRFRREIAYPPAAIGRRGEHGFGIVDLGGHLLHGHGVGQHLGHMDAGRVAAARAVGKGGDAPHRGNQGCRGLHGYLHKAMRGTIATRINLGYRILIIPSITNPNKS